MQYLIAHDLGTSGNKATLFTTDGRLVKSVTCRYATRFFNGNWAEQNPQDWWEAVCTANHRLLEDVDAAQVAAVAFSGQMMGCVVVDRNAQALRPAIIWADQRSTLQEQRLRERWDEMDFYHITGHKISASYSLEKLMWIADNEPEVFAATYKVLQPKDYIIARMTGAFVTDYSDASGTNCFDLNTFRWSQEILQSVGIDASLFPEAHASTDIAGVISPSLSPVCGLAPGTKIVLGGGDGVCAAVGAGAVRENVAYNYLGSSAWIAYASKKPVYDPQMRTYNWAHLVPGMVTPNGTMQAAGNSYEFLRQTLYGDCTPQEAYARMDAEGLASSPGANGLVYLPYLLGERSPRWNPDARGAFVGLKMEHQRGDMIRAGMEGILMNLSLILDVFRAQADISQITLIGGLAKGRLTQALIADIYGLPVCTLQALDEATSMGAAVAAGVGAGVFSDFNAIDRFIRVNSRCTPHQAQHQRYTQVKAAFEQCYQALLPVYQTLKKL
jgi:xylulokinase